MRSIRICKAESARSSKRFVGEIVPLRANADEARDQSAVEPALEDLERMTPFRAARRHADARQHQRAA